MKPKFFLMVVGLIFLWFSYSSAQVPQLTNYQGKLTDSLGKPLNDTIQMVFSIYADAGGTTLLWTETQGSVVVEKGIFNVLLGSVTPIPYSVFDGSIRYLGVKIGADPEITPRKQIVSMPYAYRSFLADTSDYARGFSGTVENTDKVDGLHASSTPTPGYLYSLDSSAKMPNDRLYTGSGNGLDADLLDGQHASDFLSTANDYGRSGVSSDLYEGTIRLTDKYVDEGQPGSVNSTMIQDFTLMRIDVASNFKAPYSDTADYARVAPADRDWSFRITDTADTTIVIGGEWGISRYGNVLLGNADSTHVNLGVACTTGINLIPRKYCTVGGGRGNTASGAGATVGGGMSNIASGSYGATVAGGWANTASGDRATIGGGWNNVASDTMATVGGGYGNIASGYYATIGGGRSDTASASFTTIGGGYHNAASGGYATIGGGDWNTASGGQSTVAGGYYNFSNSSVSIIGGGYWNITNGAYATIGGGLVNRANGYASTIAGGDSNNVDGNYATVGGGRSNSVNSSHGMVSGGYANTVSGDYSFATGNQVNLSSTADLTFAFGYNFTTSADSAAIFYISGNEVKVGIQTTNPSNILTVKYQSDTDPIADDWTTYPAPPLYIKEVQQLTSVDHEEALKKILSVPLSKYRPKAEFASGGKEKIELIVERLPEELQADGDNNAISLMKYITLLHAALKAQQEEIEVLKAQLVKLESSH